MNILITGANGFIGNHLCHVLSKKYKVTGLIRKNSIQNRNINNLSKPYQLHEDDLSAGISLGGDIDVIIHSAARTPSSNVTADDYVTDNIVATQNVIKFALIKKVKLFIYLSAFSVFDIQNNNYYSKEHKKDSASISYGLTKYLAEQLVKEVEQKIISHIFRLPLVIGKGMHTGWLFNTYNKLASGEVIHLYNGDSPYNMLHITDVCDLISKSINYTHTGCELYSVSCKKMMTVNQIVQTMKESTNSKSKIMERITPENDVTIFDQNVERRLGFKPLSAKKILSLFIKYMGNGSCDDKQHVENNNYF